MNGWLVFGARAALLALFFAAAAMPALADVRPIFERLGFTVLS
jgi:hypothetical protein